MLAAFVIAIANNGFEVTMSVLVAECGAFEVKVKVPCHCDKLKTFFDSANDSLIVPIMDWVFEPQLDDQFNTQNWNFELCATLCAFNLPEFD